MCVALLYVCKHHCKNHAQILSFCLKRKHSLDTSFKPVSLCNNVENVWHFQMDFEKFSNFPANFDSVMNTQREQMGVWKLISYSNHLRVFFKLKNGFELKILVFLFFYSFACIELPMLSLTWINSFETTSFSIMILFESIDSVEMNILVNKTKKKIHFE